MALRSLDDAIENQKKVVEKAKKSGFLTSEFWASCVGAPLVGLLSAIKLLDANSPIAAAILGVIGLAGPILYTFAREGMKKALAVAATSLVEELGKKETDK